MTHHPYRARKNPTARGRLAPTCAALLSLALSACGGSGDGLAPGAPGDGGLGENRQSNPPGKYDLFNQCWVMKADDAYVVRQGENFFANGATAAEAEKFYMRAANLARYLFYTPDAVSYTHLTLPTILLV